MMKMDVITKSGDSAIVIAKPEGFQWGPGEDAPHFDHYIVETDESPQAIRDHYVIRNGELVLRPEDEWLDVVRANAEPPAEGAQ